MRTGKNLVLFSNGTKTNAGVTFNFNNGVITANGTATGGNALSGTIDLYLNAGTYSIFNLSELPNNAFVIVQNTEILPYWSTLARSDSDRTFTLTKRTKVSVRARISNGSTVENLVFKPMLVVGTDEPSKFEPCISESVTVNFVDEAGTIYHGTLDAVTGLLTVDMAIKTETWGNFTNETAIGSLIRRQVSISDNQGDYANREKTISDIAPFVSQINDESIHVSMASSGNYLYAILPSTVTQDQVITIVYPLATSIVYHLDPNEIYTLDGINNIYADTGDVAVTYIAESARPSFSSPLHTYNYNNLKLFGNTYIEHGKG